MAKISAVEMRLLEQVFQFGGGYVLSFNDRTFAEFFHHELGLDIDDPRYSEYGGSKGKRLRHFFRLEDERLVAQALRALWAYREAVRVEFDQPETIQDAKERTFALIKSLEGGSGRASTDAIERFSPDQTLEELVAAIGRDIDANKPEAALDRLHTYCMKKFAHLLRAHGVTVGPKDTLNGRAGQFFNILRSTGRVRRISATIMKGTVEVFELYNGVRNNESLAHDNIIVEANEARFIFHAVHNMLRFVKSLEAEKPAKLTRTAGKRF